MLALIVRFSLNNCFSGDDGDACAQTATGELCYTNPAESWDDYGSCFASLIVNTCWTIWKSSFSLLFAAQKGSEKLVKGTLSSSELSNGGFLFIVKEGCITCSSPAIKPRPRPLQKQGLFRLSWIGLGLISFRLTYLRFLAVIVISGDGG